MGKVAQHQDDQLDDPPDQLDDPFNPALLKPGDILLYGPSSIYGWIIKLKTWHPISHVEIYDGNGMSWASRDGIGVNIYPFRSAQLAVVLRPTQPIDMVVAREWARHMVGVPYGWLDLLAFVGSKKRFKGIVCSPFVCRFAKVGGLNLFGPEPCHFIAPFQFETTPLVKPIWKAGGKVHRQAEAKSNL